MATETAPDVVPPAWDDASEDSKPRRRRRRFSWLYLAVPVALLAAGGVGYKLLASAGGETAHRNEMLHKVVRGNLVVMVTASGNVESSGNVDVKCEVAGGSTILWLVKDGTQVKQGDELVRLDSSTIEDQVNAQRIVYEKAQATKIEAEKNFNASKLAVQEYLEGTFVQLLQDADKAVTIAMENLRSAENTYLHTERMARKGYVTSLQREAQAFAVERGKLELASARTAKTVLEKFTKPKMLEDLTSARDTAEAKMRSEEAAFDLEEARLKRLQVQLDKCTVRAPHDGMVVYANEPGGRPGQQSVTIEEGAAVRERQSLIRLPDLSRMQVKVTVHESKVDHMHPGMRARVRIQDKDFQGEVSSVANQPEPTSWFNSGNVKEYGTIVRIEGQTAKLRPGMTAVVEILEADLHNVISVPVEAVVEQGRKTYCWVRNGSQSVRRPVLVGLSSSTQVEIRDGLSDGDMVILNPRAAVAEAREEVASEDAVDVRKKFGDAKPAAVAEGSGSSSGPGAAGGAPAGEGGSRSPDGGGRGDRPKPPSFAELDKNRDKKITRDEAPERMQGFFDNIDTNSDGAIDAKEHAALMARMRQMQAGGGPPGGPPGGP